MTLDTLASRAYELQGVYKAGQGAVTALQGQVTRLDAEIILLSHVSAALDTLIARVAQDSIGGVEQLVTYGLRSVFDDLSIAFKLQIENKRGVQWAEPVLCERGVEAPILDAFGGGPAAVVGFLLRLLVCRRLGLAPLVVLDEPFPFVSEQYREGVAKLLRELADAAGVTLIVVTHEPAYLQHATFAYEATDGGSGGNTFRLVTRPA